MENIDVKLGNGKRKCFINLLEKDGRAKFTIYERTDPTDPRSWKTVGNPKIVRIPADRLFLDLDHWLSDSDFPKIRQKRRRDPYVRQIFAAFRQFEREHPELGELILKVRTIGDAITAAREAGKPAYMTAETTATANILLSRIAGEFGYEDIPQNADPNQRLTGETRKMVLKLEELLSLAEYDSAHFD